MATVATSVVSADTRGGWTRRIVLHGEMAERFGADHEIAVASPAEAVRALEHNRSGVFQYLYEAQERGIGFAVVMADPRTGARYGVRDRDLGHPLGNRDLHIMPMPIGAGDNPVVQIIVGVVLIAAAVAITVLTGGAGSGVFAFFGALFSGFSGFLVAVGAGLALGGVAGLLSSTPGIGEVQQERDEAGAQDRLPSYAFSGPVNTTAEGRPVPIGYGTVLIGSHVVSAGIRNV